MASPDTFTVAADGDDGNVLFQQFSLDPATYTADTGDIQVYDLQTTGFPSSISRRRGLIRFDTSTLPPEAVLTGATLRLYLTTKVGYTGKNLNVDYIPVSVWPIDGQDDYDATAIASACVDDIDGMSTGGYIELALTNLEHINPAGYTAFKLYVANPTANATNQLLFESFGDTNDPELVVSYLETSGQGLLEGTITPAGTLTGIRSIRRSFGGYIGPSSHRLQEPKGTFLGSLLPSGVLNPEDPGVDPEAGIDWDIALGEYGFMTEPGTVRSDITAAIPRISVATEAKKRADFGELDTIAQESWHHGRGSYRFSDPASYFDSQYVDTRIPNQIIRSPKRHTSKISGATSPSLVGAPTDLRYWSVTDTVYLLTTEINQLFAWDNEEGAWDQVTAVSSLLSGNPARLYSFTLPGVPPLTSSQEFFLISRGYDEPYIYTSNAGVNWTVGPSNDYGSKARLFTQFKERLVFDVSSTTIILRPDPSTDSQTTDILINNLGAGDEAINNLVLLGDSLVVLKEGSAYLVLYDMGTDSYQTRPIIDYSNMRHPDNGKGATVKDGALYFNVLQGVLEFNGTTTRWVGPDLGAMPEAIAVADSSGVIQVRGDTASFQGPDADKRGAITSMTADPNWLYGAIEPSYYGGTVRTITAYGGTGWHDLTQEIGDQTGGFVAYLPKLAVEGVLSTPTLWYRHGLSLKYLKLPLGTDNRWDYEAADYEDEADSWLITPWFDADLLEVWKDWLQLMVTMEILTEQDNIAVEFQVNGDDSWKSLGTTVGLEPFRFPDNSMTIGYLRARSIRLRLTLNGTPRLTGYFFKFLSRPFPRYGWQLRVVAGRVLDLIHNVQSTLTSEEHAQRLYDLRQRPGPIRFDDGRTYSGLHNYLKNPGFEGWNAAGTLPVNWTAVGSPTLAQESQYAYQGGYSCSVICAAGEGIVSAATASLPVDTYHAVARLRVVSGQVKVELVKDSSTVKSSIVDRNVVAFDFGSLGLEAFEREVLEYTASTAGSYQLKITGLTAAVFQVDATELREGEDDGSPYISEGEPRCRGLIPGTFFDTVSVRLPYFLCYVSGISENLREPERDLNGLRYNSVFLVELREAD